MIAATRRPVRNPNAHIDRAREIVDTLSRRFDGIENVPMAYALDVASWDGMVKAAVRDILTAR